MAVHLQLWGTGSGSIQSSQAAESQCLGVTPAAVKVTAASCGAARGHSRVQVGQGALRLEGPTLTGLAVYVCAAGQGALRLAGPTLTGLPVYPCEHIRVCVLVCMGGE